MADGQTAPSACFRGTASLALAALLGAGGCAVNDVSFFIQQNQVPQPNGTNGTCIVDANPSSLMRSAGVLDVLLRDTYGLNPLYHSELLSDRDPTAARPETRGLFVDGARIELHDGSPDNPLIVPEFMVSLSTYVPPSTMATPGFAVGGIEVIPASVGQALQGQVCELGATTAACPVPQITSHPKLIVAVVHPFGHTMGGIQLEGAPYNFPINVCCGCLLSFPSDADNPMVPGHDCDGASTTTTTSCGGGQDDPVDCRLCSGGNLLCEPQNFGAACTR